MENMLTDLLSFIDDNSSDKFNYSFSMIFESLRGFLLAEGGGYIRFFHDQLNKVVREKYLEKIPLFEKEIHQWFSRFYNQTISPQLKQAPNSSAASTYHESC